MTNNRLYRTTTLFILIVSFYWKLQSFSSFSLVSLWEQGFYFLFYIPLFVYCLSRIYTLYSLYSASSKGIIIYQRDRFSCFLISCVSILSILLLKAENSFDLVIHILMANNVYLNLVLKTAPSVALDDTIISEGKKLKFENILCYHFNDHKLTLMVGSESDMRYYHIDEFSFYELQKILRKHKIYPIEKKDVLKMS